MSARRFSPPRPLSVAADAAKIPRAIQWRGQAEQVVTIEATWEVGTGWWRVGDETSARRYYRIVTQSGLQAEIYREGQPGRWYLAAIAD